MAPEVISQHGYDNKADIWSLGITAIELAETRPPHTELGHPLKALMKIPLAPSPTLKEPEKWSDEFKNFLKLCLSKDPSRRGSAAQLLEVPFDCPFVTINPKYTLSDELPNPTGPIHEELR